MKTLKQWWTDHKMHARNIEFENIKSDFKVAEKSGKIYLMHGGYAFAVMSKDESAAEIASKLNEARKAALEFEGL